MARKPVQVQNLKHFFLTRYAHAKTELNYSNLYELLVAVILSAQCTDKRVNQITPALFNAFPNIQKLAHAHIDEVKDLIKSCTYFNNKAKNLIAMAQRVLVHFDGKIPLEQKSLMSLAGVGQKTAHVVLVEFAQANVMPVDTHIFRVSHRLGLSQASTAKATAADLTQIFEDKLHILHQAMVLFGRYICKARNPLCLTCPINNLCKSKARFKIG